MAAVTLREVKPSLIDWINEIHCWALIVHGLEGEKDDKLLLIN